MAKKPDMAEKPKVEGVDAFMIYADDPEAMATWYDEVLGISTRLESDGNRYGEVADEESDKELHVGIYPSEPEVPYRRRSVMINFRVADLDAFASRLRERGVELGEVVDEGYGKFLHFSDPEGHPVELWQPVADASKDEPSGKESATRSQEQGAEE